MMTAAVRREDAGRAGRVVVLGSANADLVVEVPRRPGAGETLLGSDLRVFAGGKGANQAAAAARCGASTALIACVGDDGNGMLVRRALADAGVDVGAIASVGRPTGTALILVTPDGENSIVVSPGANHALDVSVAQVTEERWAGAGVLALNLETPLATVEHVAVRAAERGVRVLVNAAPAHPLSAATLAVCDPVVVNEHEARILAGDGGDRSFEELARDLLVRGARSVVITLGAAGALHADVDGVGRVPAHAVDVVDTTGAGDAFVGAMACELARGAVLRDAVAFATAVAAISVRSMGAQASYPDRAEVERMLTGA
ncbi:ribokinase [Microbacterium sp. NPDC089695]|uniref:ribokinase n=1 Tax=Microbacterium sp. NPDC089695 TaxID=3364198 RepID=UPI00381218DC